MTIHAGKLLVYGDVVLLKNIQAPPPPPEYYRTFYNIVSADSNSFNCVWADIDSSQSTGKVYFSTSGGGVYVIDLEGRYLYQYITPVSNNVTNEVIVQDDVFDLNVIN
jgi:hypothetical protein